MFSLKFVPVVSLIVSLGWLAVTPARAQSTPAKGATQVPVVFSGGHETDERDHGRPVVLVAAALGVPPEVFRDAFSRVRPVGPGSGGPTDSEARTNKKALMDALYRYGVTNERLDEVSNYYRYARSQGELWTTKTAEAYAIIENGTVTRYVVTTGGSGYTSEPKVTVPSINGAPVPKVQVSFDKALKSNGSITAISILPPK